MNNSSPYSLYRLRLTYIRGKRVADRELVQIFPCMGDAIQARDVLVTRNGGAGAMYAVEPTTGHDTPPKYRVSEGPQYDPNS